MGTLNVSPPRLTIEAEQKAGSVTITNAGNEPKLLQVSIKKWTQENNEDVLVDSKEVIVNPPAFTVEPGEQQIIRLGLRGSSPRHEEQAYRMTIKEVPTATENSPKQSLNILMAMSLPVFFEPENPRANANWELQQEGDKVKLSVTNTGNVHQRITKFEFFSKDVEEPFYSQGDNAYLFPNQTKEWTFTIDKASLSTPWSVVINANKGQVRKQLTD